MITTTFIAACKYKGWPGECSNVLADVGRAGALARLPLNLFLIRMLGLSLVLKFGSTPGRSEATHSGFKKQRQLQRRRTRVSDPHFWAYGM